MYKGKKFLAIIPARSGSKELKDKNIKPFCGKPLIEYSIEVAKESGIFDYIFLSTDSENYAEIAKKCGIAVPFMRPKEIAKDNSPADEYIFHAIESLMKIGKVFDYFILLQPTSPLRTADDIKKAANLLISEQLTSVVSVCETEYPIEYCNKLPPDLSLHNFLPNIANRQELSKSYRINGALYLCECESYLKYRDFYSKNSKAYIMPQIRSIDIDTELNFSIAEYIKNHLIFTISE
jgi:CMP-N-acetylneuraminic acid synthetase